MLIYRRIRSTVRGVVSQDAWEKIGRAVGAKTVLVTVGDHDIIVSFERFD